MNQKQKILDKERKAGVLSPSWMEGTVSDGGAPVSKIQPIKKMSQ